ncbi:YfcL family protein [uncultured Paraglaciecola sp.]|uniref:YfcL family protein n=1 Tax=uncultured Paraglaciecola sp. TaxID=1765024 RepID=UPI0030DC966B
MTLSKQAANELTLFIQKTENYLDQVVENGNDQELFIASYLQGHFAVAAGQSQVRNMTQITQLNELMETSLDTAFDNNELAADDQQQVLNLWQVLLAN